MLIEKGGDPKLKLPNLQFKSQILNMNPIRNNAQHHPYQNVIEQKASVFQLEEEPSVDLAMENIGDEEAAIDGGQSYIEMAMAENDFSDNSEEEENEEEEDEMGESLGEGIGEAVNNA